ncbi:aldehyde dehydrogenase family protein [Nocardia terpenica]|uniref:aldehyde dehydrogenase family protein n=1 Tax=Nocardia terpenica TaxID=455432 RepID=UPI0002DB5887|nr:aldehyde dehydrogenase [Nocardia terpenica]NQE86184.1 aldehyde dehydrogenase [Nocardia terpenica]
MTASITEQGIASYGSYIAGKDVPGDHWVYVFSATAILEDTFAMLALKRQLERGDPAAPAELPPAVVARVAVADADAVADALSAAAAAFPTWRAFPLEARFDTVGARIHANLIEHREAIEHLMVEEGHPIAVARFEVGAIIDSYSPQALAYLRGQLWWETRRDGRRIVIRRRPDGVVCVNPPANSPTVSAAFFAAAVLGGNTVVVRAPRTVPLSIMYTMREVIAPALDAVGAPPGTLNVVCGQPAPMMETWLNSPHVADIIHVGSVESGRKYEQLCVAAGKKPILELSGNDLVLVWADADLPAAAAVLVESFFGSGQICMLPNQALVHPAVADELIALMVERAREVRPGYPEEPGALLAPVLRQDGYRNVLADAVRKGARVVTGGHGMDFDGNRDERGFFLAPTIVRVDGLAAAREVDAVAHETFFPLLPVVVPDPADESRLLDEFVDFANSNPYGLRNSLWARDPAVIDRFLRDVDNGGVLKINDSHLGYLAPLAPQGGTGVTGGVFGEASYPVLRTTRLQSVAIVESGSGTPAIVPAPLGGES